MLSLVAGCANDPGVVATGAQAGTVATQTTAATTPTTPTTDTSPSPQPSVGTLPDDAIYHDVVGAGGN